MSAETNVDFRTWDFSWVRDLRDTITSPMVVTGFDYDKLNQCCVLWQAQFCRDLKWKSLFTMRDKIQNWHSEECKLAPTSATFDHLTSNKCNLSDCKITFIVAPSGECWLVAAAVSTLHLFDSVTLTFNRLTSNEMGDQNLSCTVHLPSSVMIDQVVFFVLECWRTHTRTHTHTYRAAKRSTHHFDYVGASKNNNNTVRKRDKIIRLHQVLKINYG